MPVRLYKAVLLVAGALLFGAGPGYLATGSAADQPRVRTWTDRTGEYQTEASLVDSQDGKVTLKKKDGTTIKIPLESLSDADREYVKHHTSGDHGASALAAEVGPAAKPKQHGSSSRYDRGGNVAEINISGGKKSARAALPESKEVIVTGVGTDPEKALQNAFSQAIEQTVGLLVDAETVVKNDELIHDEVLTYSRGYMESYEVVRRWQEGGLHHAKIRGLVAREKLVAKLRGIKIAAAEVAGEITSRQIEFDVKNEEQAAEMFKKALAGFDMTKLTKVEIVGKPEITREGNGASVRIKVQLSPDQKRWNEVARDIRLILSKASTKRAAVTTRGNVDFDVDKVTFGGKLNDYEAGERLKRQLEGDGLLVGLFSGSSFDGSRMEWEVFRVPKAIAEAIAASGIGSNYRVVYTLLDERGDEIVRTTSRTEFQQMQCCPALRREKSFYPIYAWWVGPVWDNGVHIRGVFVNEADISLTQQDLRRLSRTAAFLEEDTGHGR